MAPGGGPVGVGETSAPVNLHRQRELTRAAIPVEVV